MGGGSRSGRETNCCDGGGSIPAHVRDVRSDRYGGAVGRVTAPAEAVGAIRIGAAAETEVEDHASAGVELRHVGLVSPTDEEMAVRQVLRIALVDGEKRWPVDEPANEHRALGTQIEPQHD